MKARNTWRVLALLGFGLMATGPATVRSADPTAAENVERGKYLVTIGGCNDCHTPKVMTDHGPAFDEARTLSGQPANDPIPPVPKDALSPTGWMAMCNAHMTAWAGPWGISFASNLTPDKQTGLGDWTEDQFIKALRTGKHRGFGRPLLPPMPWEPLGHLPDEDLKAIFAYLHSIPAVSNKVPDVIPPTAGK